MLASLSGSEEILLRALWSVTLALTVASIAMLFVLAVRRARAQCVEQKKAAENARIKKILLSALTLRERLPDAALPSAKDIDPHRAVDAALELLRSIEGADQQFITRALRRWNIVGHLEHELQHGRRGARIRALTLLSYFQEKDTLPLIAGHTKAADPYVQLAAIRALAERGAIRELPRIIKALTESAGVNPVMLADVLCRFGPKASPAFLHLAMTETAPLGARVAALRAMNTVGSSADVGNVKVLLSDPSPEIRAKALTLLTKSDAKEAIGLIKAALNDSSSFVRIRAAQAAGIMKITSAAPQLLIALKDDNWWMRYRAAEALRQFGGKGEQILKAVARGSGEAAVTAAQVIAEKRAVNE